MARGNGPNESALAVTSITETCVGKEPASVNLAKYRVRVEFGLPFIPWCRYGPSSCCHEALSFGEAHRSVNWVSAMNSPEARLVLCGEQFESTFRSRSDS